MTTETGGRMKTNYELKVDEDGFATLVTRQPLGPVRGCSHDLPPALYGDWAAAVKDQDALDRAAGEGERAAADAWAGRLAGLGGRR